MIKIESTDELLIVFLMIAWAEKNSLFLMDNLRETCSDEEQASSHWLLANCFNLYFNFEDESGHEHRAIDIHGCFGSLILD